MAFPWVPRSSGRPAMTSVPLTYGCLVFPVTGLTEFVPAPLLVLSQILVLSRLPLLSDGTPAPPGVGRTGAADTAASLLLVLVRSKCVATCVCSIGLT